MDIKINTFPALTCDFVVAPEADSSLEKPIIASSRDYGFDFDEEELGRELLAPIPVSTATPTIPEVEAEECEQAYLYFLS